nr:unnamed protein product [Digitaria exilis]
MYILQEIPSPQPRTVDLTVRNNLSISWADDRKYPYSNPGTHPHVGPTSGDHPVSYRSRSRLSPTQQARHVRSFRDTRFRSDDDHFLDLSLLLRESHELLSYLPPRGPSPPFKQRSGAAGAPADLDRGPSPAASLPGQGNGTNSSLPTQRTYSSSLPPRLVPGSWPATTRATAREWRSPAGQTTTPNAPRASLRAPATIGDPSAPPSASRDAPERPAHVRQPWRTCARRRTRRRRRATGNPSPKPSQQLAYEHQGTKGKLAHPLARAETAGARLPTRADGHRDGGGQRRGKRRRLGSEIGEAQRRLFREVKEFKVELWLDKSARRAPPATEKNWKRGGGREEEERRPRRTPAEHTATAIPCPATRGRATDVDRHCRPTELGTEGLRP